MSPPCCPDGSWPQLMTTTNADLNKDDSPFKGTRQSIPVEGQEEFPIYVVEPPTGNAVKGSILVLPDIYSVRALLPDSRSGDRTGAICDALAEQGYLVVLAGTFRGNPYDQGVAKPDDGNFLEFDPFSPDGGVAWIASHTYEKLGPCVKAAAAFLKEKAPAGTKLGVLGFCHGSWLLSKASSTGDVDFDCAIGCHPTTQLENAVFGRDESAMMANLRQPTTFLWAGNDPDSWIGDGVNKTAVEKTGGRVHEFPDMLHGWVSRGDVSDEAVKAGVESALTTIKDVFAAAL